MSFKMKYPIRKQYLTSGSKRRSGIKMPKVGFLVAHDTGNPNSTAAGNVKYYENSRNEESASAQIFVDDKEIVECIPFLTGTPEKAWHVLYQTTVDDKMYGDDANDIAGGVELCYGSKINAKEAYARYIWVLAYSCYKFKLNPAKAIVGHHILDPKRKIDPVNGLNKMGPGYSYAKLLKDVINEYNDCTAIQESVVYEDPAVIGSIYKIQKGDTFWSISQRMKNVTVQDLIKWNPTANAADLKIGQVINISAPAEVKKPTTPEKAPATTVKKESNITVPTVVLKKGDKGTNVLNMQQALASIYFYPEKGAPANGCDGTFGAKTENCVMRFQTAHGLTADGVWGPKSAAKLKSLL